MKRLPACVLAIVAAGAVIGSGAVTSSAQAAPGPTKVTSVAEKSKSKGSVLNIGDRLHKGEHITSPNGQYVLAFTEQSNLAFYGPSGHIWGTNLWGNADSVVMRDDNNLCFRGSMGKEWNSRTSHLAPRTASGVLQAVVTDQGKFQIRDSKASSGESATVVWENGTRFPYVGSAVLKSGDQLRPNEEIRSLNGQYRLELRLDPDNYGAVALSGPSGPIWQSERVLLPIFGMTMHSDGDLKLGGFKQLWTSDTSKFATQTTGPLETVVTNDGKLQIRGSKNLQPLWEVGKLG